MPHLTDVPLSEDGTNTIWWTGYNAICWIGGIRHTYVIAVRVVTVHARVARDCTRYNYTRHTHAYVTTVGVITKHAPELHGIKIHISLTI